MSSINVKKDNFFSSIENLMKLTEVFLDNNSRVINEEVSRKQQQDITENIKSFNKTYESFYEEIGNCKNKYAMTQKKQQMN